MTLWRRKANKKSHTYWEFPNLCVSNLVVCDFYVEALFCALLRSFANLRLRSFALFSFFLHAFACFCVRPRLERPRLGTAELSGMGDSQRDSRESIRASHSQLKPLLL